LLKPLYRDTKRKYKWTMPSSRQIIILGASARAAAFSALRAGLRPWCADLFADADLQTCCPVIQIPSDEYPSGFENLSDKAPPGSWLYTGGLENHPRLVEGISAKRPLWGNGAKALARARSPARLAKIFGANKIHFPAISELSPKPSQHGRWLIKPRRGAGGAGIQFMNLIGVRTRSNKQAYYQEYIEGLPCSAVYVGLAKSAKLLGATRQLVGEPWLNAAPFHYCGSIGPLPLELPIRREIERIGYVLVQECQLRGLFGVDFILSDGIPWPVEINPRYPASTEILEYALGIKAMAFHRLAFDADIPEPPPVANAPGSEGPAPFMGKAVLFAKRSLAFPMEGPWTSSVGRKSIQNMPDFADIPEPGRIIKAGAPILTFFAQSTTMSGCVDALKERAPTLTR
jgi:predicted ATP-grasp superfamily ATP-dependent carboligase